MPTKTEEIDSNDKRWTPSYRQYLIAHAPPAPFKTSASVSLETHLNVHCGWAISWADQILKKLEEENK